MINLSDFSNENANNYYLEIPVWIMPLFQIQKLLTIHEF